MIYDLDKERAFKALDAFEEPIRKKMAALGVTNVGFVLEFGAGSDRPLYPGNTTITTIIRPAGWKLYAYLENLRPVKDRPAGIWETDYVPVSERRADDLDDANVVAKRIDWVADRLMELNILYERQSSMALCAEMGGAE